MKLFNRYLGIAFGFMMLMPIHAHADILINCNWVVTGVVTMPGAIGGTVTTSQCSDGNIIAATRSVGSGNNICGLTASTGYRVEGSCLSPVVYRIVLPTSSSSSSSLSSNSCPMAGKSYGIVTIGAGQPAFPADKINEFCKANLYWNCGFTATYIGPGGPGQHRYNVTCVTK